MYIFNAIFAKNYSIMAFKWIFFDLDDTLFDFSSASIISLRKLWEENSQIRNRFDSADAFIGEYHIHNKHLWHLHESGKITADFLKPERFRLTITPNLHDEDTVKSMRAVNDRYLWHLGQCNAPMKGAKDVLEELSKKCLIGVLTNGFTEVQYRKLRSSGLDRYIQRMVVSDEIRIPKPDPRIFRYAEEATGAKSDNILMVGDNPDNDIKGALDAGWHAIYYDWKEKPFESDSDLFLGRIDNLLDIEKFTL